MGLQPMIKMGRNLRILFILLLFEFGYTVDTGCKNNGPLGMITGSIQDWQITASSTYPKEWDRGCHEKYARVYLPNKLGWCAKYKSASEWLRVDLGVAAKVTGVMTQGRGDGVEWVTSYMISSSMDAFNWVYIVDQYGNKKVFEGNIDSFSVKHSYLDEPIIARYIKFHVVHWHRHPSMRVEVLGCQLCKEMIGLPPYGRISTSTHKRYRKGSSCQSEDGNILSSKAWCSKRQNKEQWLEIDVGPPTLVTGIITKGRADTRKKHWVTEFTISFGNTTDDFIYYKDAHHTDSRIFGGNTDKHSERIHYLNSPFIARYVRFHPKEWHGKISMRAGLLGCPYAGDCHDGFMRVNRDTPCVENLAYTKEAWIKRDKTSKRVARGHRPRFNQALRAVDGNITSALPSCTILDNLYGDIPAWVLDLGQNRNVAGLVIYTWQNRPGDPGNSLKEYQNNLDKLVVYLSEKEPKEESNYGSGNMCGYVSRLNGALFQPKLHMSCITPQKGRYLVVEAWGLRNSWSRLFSAVLCEVLVYS